MKVHQLRRIFGLTALATLAIVGLQAYIWKQGLEQGRDHFSRSLHRAVDEAVEDFVRPFETRIMLNQTVGNDTLALRSPGIISLQIGQVDSIRHFTSVDADSLTDALAYIDLNVVKKTIHAMDDTSRNSARFVLSDTLSDNIIFRHQEVCPDCETGISQLSNENFKPLLEKELANHEIDTPFQWGVQHMGDWLIVDGDTALLASTQWQFPFFSFPIGSMEHTFEMTASGTNTNTLTEFSPPLISLYFPSERWHLLRSVSPTLLFSTVLAFFVLGCIGYGLLVIMRQKQLSEIKTDFINNMTHEFKTPISTISLACEAMQDREVAISGENRNKYLTMIATENDRLAAQVEKVLQMALLDKKDLGLKMERVSVHVLLREIVNAFSLQLRQREGSVATVLDARKDVIEGDMMHLRQMFTNLLDNANKYSPESPQIRIETKNTDAGIEIAVHDKGLGISRDALRKVFDRFYRVPTGNLHDIKGFGLGLSYVQTMAMAHGGYIRATSKPGYGSSFYLYLPHDHG